MRLFASSRCAVPLAPYRTDDEPRTTDHGPRRAFHVRLIVSLVAVSCGSSPEAPADTFLKAIAAHCGQAFEGRVVADEPPAPNTPFENGPLIMHVRTCEPERVLVPFHVGDDRSRTWVITRTATGLRLKHDHRHQDGSEDVLTMYGGDTTAAGTPSRQEFPVDAFSRELFERQNAPASMENTWAMEIEPKRLFAYELTRPGRRFRVEFDLTAPVPAPPAPWGH